MPVSKAQQKATIKYRAKAYDRLDIRFPKGRKDVIKQHAAKHDGGSVNAFVNRAINETLARDNEKEEKK